MVVAGVPENEAKAAVHKKLSNLEISNHRNNYGHAVDIARQLQMPYMNIHMPLDEVGRQRMAETISDHTDSKSTLVDVISTLNSLGEFRNAETAIKIRIGQPNNLAGSIVVSHGAGTNGGVDIARVYYKYGVDTLLYIHISPADLSILRSDIQGNLIITGHVASDSVGINPLIQELETRNIAVTRIGIIPP
jgi:hypothetical protein